MEAVEQAIIAGRDLALYQESEQADTKQVAVVIDALWQSIYDVCRLINLGIIEDDQDDEDLVQAIAWLQKYQPLTKAYQKVSLDF